MSEMTPRRPSPELLSRLREGKREFHAAQRSLSAPDKVRMVIELQRFTLPIIAKRRALTEIERPWPLDD
ncbi:MAG: hypothetical protein HYU52_17010 [Acidobacteria bacterium]|nr:hypothetical protein [Acidobacteriota bacterium]